MGREVRRLIVVESPNKVARVQAYAGDGYRVVATAGHIRDLPARRIGIRIADGRFEPAWELLDRARDNVRRIADLAREADEVLLATDPDREGEAIAWHVIDECRIARRKVRRVTFREITAPAVRAALERPADIDQSLVAAAVSRRLIDRFVGYEVSPVLQAVSRDLRAAGRVQTPTLYFVVARERERERFVARTYWTVAYRYDNGLEAGVLADDTDPNEIETVDDDDRDEGEEDEGECREQEQPPWLRLRQFADPGQAEKFALEVAVRAHRVTRVYEQTKVRCAPGPFTTATMLVEANRRLRMSADRAMRAAQELFESGLITYHRTDSQMMSREAIELARETIGRWAPEALDADAPVAFEDPRAQGAHEGIRPTPEGIARVERGLDEAARDGAVLLRLIAARFVASQSAPMELAATVALIEAGPDMLAARGIVVTRPGWGVFMSEYMSVRQREVPRLEDGQLLVPITWSAPERETRPPARHTEASLIERMQRDGIGRPSTYATTLASLERHGLIARGARDISPTHSGTELVATLEQLLPGLLSPSYTAATEALLDEIGHGRASGDAVLAGWYAAHRLDLERARGVAAEGSGNVPVTTHACRECGLPVERRQGKYGHYERCPNGHRPHRPAAGVSCPECGAGMERREGASGEFYGCSRYPECRRTMEAVGRNPEPDCDDAALPPPTSNCPVCDSALEGVDAAGAVRLRICTGSIRCFACDSALEACGGRRPGWKCDCMPDDRIAPSELVGRARIGHLFAVTGAEQRGVTLLVRLEHLTECPACRAAPELVRSGDLLAWECQCGTRTPAEVYDGSWQYVDAVAARARAPVPRPELDVRCPKCGRMMRVRTGSRGRFLSCSGFPACDGAIDLAPRDAAPRPDEPEGHANCPDCDSPMRLRHSKTGAFYGCTAYPSCRRTIDARGAAGRAAAAAPPPRERVRAAPAPPATPCCPECGSAMQERRGPTGPFYGCTAYPRCRHTAQKGQ